MLDDSTGWIAGYELVEKQGIPLPVRETVIVYRTVDGWASFERLEYSASFSPTDLYFRDRERGWITGLETGRLLESRDGGVTWQERHIGADAQLISLQFRNSEQGWITAVNAVFHTGDGGETWAYVQYTDDLRLQRIRFLSAEIGFGIGESDRWNNGIYRSSDGGESWDLLAVFLNPKISDFHTVSGSTFLGVGQVLMSSTDSARTWEIINTQVGGSAMEFWSPLQGVIMGQSETWLTDNGGVTWYRGTFEDEPIQAPRVEDYAIVGDRLFVLAGNSVWFHSAAE